MKKLPKANKAKAKLYGFIPTTCFLRCSVSKTCKVQERIDGKLKYALEKQVVGSFDCSPDLSVAVEILNRALGIKSSAPNGFAVIP